MTVMSKFPHVEQFRNVIRRVKEVTRYAGKDENGEVIFNSAPLPKLKFHGTTKLHGTNAGVGILNDGTQWAQSRENIITPEKDNAGFATFAYKNREFFASVKNNFGYGETLYNGFVIYGEWCGKGIQKGVAVSELEKMFVVFGIKLLSSDPETRPNTWVCDDAVKELIGHNEDIRIFNIFEFGTWELEIDFDYPELSSNKMIELTEEVEKECPVGKYFGVSSVGEGIVWKCRTEPYVGGDFMFKVKGEKHSVSKVKTLAAVDVEKVNSIKECVDKIITENRLNQGLDHLRTNHLEIVPQNLGVFIKWVTSDAIREELDTIIESGLIPKDVGSVASKVARDWFFRTTQFSLEKN
jgi:hypothetical protein